MRATPFWRICGLAVLAIILVFPLGGCEELGLTSETKTELSQAKQKTAVEAAKVANDNTVAVAKEKALAELHKLQGDDAPGKHPWYALNNLVVGLRTPLKWITLASFVLWAICWGVSASTLPGAFIFGEAIRPLRVLSIMALAACVALPFLPIGLIIFFGTLTTLTVYEVVKDKGNVAEAVSDEETFLGLKSAAATSPATAATANTSTTATLKPVATPATVSTATATPAAQASPVAPDVPMA